MSCASVSAFSLNNPSADSRTAKAAENGPCEFDVDHRVEDRARFLLERHPHFHGRSDWIQIRYRNRCLRLDGQLPSFYLKQLAQEALRNIDGVEQIDNQIMVASPQGHVFYKNLELRLDRFSNSRNPTTTNIQ